MSSAAAVWLDRRVPAVSRSHRTHSSLPGGGIRRGEEPREAARTPGGAWAGCPPGRPRAGVGDGAGMGLPTRAGARIGVAPAGRAGAADRQPRDRGGALRGAAGALGRGCTAAVPPRALVRRASIGVEPWLARLHSFPSAPMPRPRGRLLRWPATHAMAGTRFGCTIQLILPHGGHARSSSRNTSARHAEVAAGRPGRQRPHRPAEEGGGRGAAGRNEARAAKE